MQLIGVLVYALAGFYYLCWRNVRANSSGNSRRHQARRFAHAACQAIGVFGVAHIVVAAQVLNHFGSSLPVVVISVADAVMGLLMLRIAFSAPNKRK